LAGALFRLVKRWQHLWNEVHCPRVPEPHFSDLQLSGDGKRAVDEEGIADSKQFHRLAGTEGT
jgi:hypothetical protein